MIGWSNGVGNAVVWGLQRTNLLPFDFDCRISKSLAVLVDLLEDTLVVHRRWVVVPQQCKLSALCGIVANLRQIHAAMRCYKLKSRSWVFSLFADFSTEGSWNGLILICVCSCRSAGVSPKGGNQSVLKKILFFEWLLSLNKDSCWGQFKDSGLDGLWFTVQILQELCLFTSTGSFWIALF